MGLARQHRSDKLSARHPLSPPLRRRPPPTTDWRFETSTVLRSESLIPRSLTESSVMLSWRGTVDDWTGAGCFRILLPLDVSAIVPGVLSETALDEQMMKLKQCRYCYTRRADRRHTGAGDRVQHPCGDCRDHAGASNVNNLPGSALFAVVSPHPAPIVVGGVILPRSAV